MKSCMLSPESERLRRSLDPGHVIHTMVIEHDKILGFLDDMEAGNLEIQRAGHFDAGNAVYDTLRRAVSHLVGAEPHHRREEEVLFPELEKHGIFGPPQVMREEHVELRRLKHQAKDLLEGLNETRFAAFRSSLDPVARNLVGMLRAHIDKENGVLYPMALRAITSPADWERLREECDRIGYCCFSPQKAKK